MPCDSIPPDLNEWIKFVEHFLDSHQVKFSRFVLIFDAIIADLHKLNYASEQANGASLYMCPTNKEGLVNSSLLCNKSKTSPTKSLTVPTTSYIAVNPPYVYII